MKQVSGAFKEAIKQYGRQLDVMITYTENGTSKMLTNDDLFSVTPVVNANLMKSVMKQLDFESYIKVPKDTWINVRFGILVGEGYTVEQVHQMRVDRLNSTEVRMLQGFEYVDLGDYLVTEEPEYNADTSNYLHKCFDKMIFAMKAYEPLNVTYPISIKNYLNALANKINIKPKPSNFYNQHKIIERELYEGLGYTYRDVLDEIAQATGSIICVNDLNKLEVRYLTNTNETINEDYLKDINVEFKDKYGLINSVVLSRSAGSDNVYLRDEQSVAQNGLCEIKISDNQILNSNNRSDFLQGILSAVNGISYYINDFKSPGICYLEIGDKYNVQIGEKTYSCVLLNDEINITQGLEEQIYTEMPEQSETDYTKADKTDQKINQTNLIIDKQQQQITATVSRVEANEENISSLQIDVTGIHTEVSKKVGNDEIISKINQSAEAVTINANKISLSGKDIDLTGDNVTISSNKFNVDKYGNMTCNNADITGGSFNVSALTGSTDTFRINNRNNNAEYTYVGPTNNVIQGTEGHVHLQAKSAVSDHSYVIVANELGTATIITEEWVQTPQVIQTSLESQKKNFEKYNNALDVIKNIDIYKYNLKNEEDGTKKHIGFVIGENFNYREEITSKNNDGVDIYSFVSLCCQAIKEQQEEIEKLRKEIDNESNNKSRII